MGFSESFDVVLTKSHESIFSEMHIVVENVLLDTIHTGHVGSGTSSDVLTPGGSVKLPDSSVLAFHTQQHPFGLTPGVEYVLFSVTYKKVTSIYSTNLFS